MDKKLSQLINAIRFPLIILVLYIHMGPHGVHAIPEGWDLLKIDIFIRVFISSNLGRIVVPTFFLISGYLFFYKLEANSWSLARTYCKTQCQKRFKTLVIPYVLWNILLVVCILGREFLLTYLNKDSGTDLQELVNLGTIGWLSKPINFPLWYLRDLICMCLISPGYIYLYKYLKHWGLVLLCLIYLLNFESNILGFSSTAIFFFGIGGYCSIHKLNILDIVKPFKVYPLLLSLIVFFIGTLYFNTSDYREYWIKWATLVGVIGIFYPFKLLLDFSPRLAQICNHYSNSVFFIYAVHEVYLRKWVQGAFHRLPIFNEGFGWIAGYLLKPIILLLLCLAIDKFFRRYLPLCYSYLTGTRTRF